MLDRFLRYAIWCAVIWFIFIATTNYFNLRLLWNDEECVFKSVKAFSTFEMFNRPLLSAQVFPRGYLYLIQKFSSQYDFSLLSLRLPSFICMMLGLFFWMRLVSFELTSRLEYFTYALSWTASSLLLYYASELKPYSMDVMVAGVYLLFIYSTFHRLKGDSKWPCPIFMLMLYVLPFFCFFSYPSLLFALIVLYNLIVATARFKVRPHYLIIFSCSLVTALILSYTYDMQYRNLDTVTKGFGDYFISYVSIGEFFRTLGEGLNNLFSRFLDRKSTRLNSSH